MRKRNLIIILAAMLLADIIIFIWMPYPKSFIATIGSSDSVFYVIPYLVYCVFFTGIILVTVKTIAYKNIKLTKKLLLHAAVIYSLILSIFDLINNVLGLVLDLYAQLTCDLLTVASWFVIIFTFCRLVGVKSINAKRFFVLSLPCVLVLLVAAFLMDIKDITYLKSTTENYMPHSGEVTLVLQITNFMFGLRNAALDYLSGAAVISALFFATPAIKSTDDDLNPAD